jgi:putative flippase GtrA
MYIYEHAKSVLFKYLKFLFGGWLTTLIELIITFTITELFGVWFIYSYACASISASFFSFFYHRHVTFNMIIRKRTILKYWIILAIILSLTITILYFVSGFVDNYILMHNLSTLPLIKYHYLLLIVLVSIPISILNFFLNMYHIFSVEHLRPGHHHER